MVVFSTVPSLSLSLSLVARLNSMTKKKSTSAKKPTQTKNKGKEPASQSLAGCQPQKEALFFCNEHLFLPVTEFYKSDVRGKIHCCKVCKNSRSRRAAAARSKEKIFVDKLQVALSKMHRKYPDRLSWFQTGNTKAANAIAERFGFKCPLSGPTDCGITLVPYRKTKPWEAWNLVPSSHSLARCVAKASAKDQKYDYKKVFEADDRIRAAVKAAYEEHFHTLQAAEQAALLASRKKKLGLQSGEGEGAVLSGACAAATAEEGKAEEQVDADTCGSLEVLASAAVGGE